MDDVLYGTLSKYFQVLSHLGYHKYSDVYKIIYLSAIREFVYHDFYGEITEDDYRQIERSLYCIFGSSCMIPYPAFCKNKKTMDKLSLGTITSLANKVKKLEGDVDEVKKVKVVKTNGGVLKIVPDIKFG